MDRNTEITGRCGYGLQVVPYVGTWIEMTYRDEDLTQNSVVPYVGTWIEISAQER